MYGTYLVHHGIKGQRWGIRRYQNEDGTFTEEGKKRYGIEGDGQMSQEGRRAYSADRAKQDYKNAKEEHKSALKNFNRKPMKGYTYEDWDRDREQISNAFAKRELARANMKAARQNDPEKAKKAEFHSISSSMMKNDDYGSGFDAFGSQRKFRETVAMKKGTEYANKAIRASKNKTIAVVAGSTAASLGAGVVAAIIASKT